jgi:flagellar hook-associated protein 2
MADLGLTFDGAGNLDFNQSQFTSIAASDPSDVAAFLGTGTGSGFLASATNALNGLTDPTNGLFQSEQTSFQNQVNADNTEITATQARITTMQNQLTAQMTAADTLISSLQSQDSFMTQLFQAQNAIASSS